MGAASSSKQVVHRQQQIRGARGSAAGTTARASRISTEGHDINMVPTYYCLIYNNGSVRPSCCHSPARRPRSRAAGTA